MGRNQSGRKYDMILNQDKVPSTLDEAVDILKEGLAPEELALMKNKKSAEFHFSIGMMIRNEWSLWETGNILNIWFLKTYGVKHADDISGIIIECLLNDINGVPRRDKILAQEFIAHWKKNQQ